MPEDHTPINADNSSNTAVKEAPRPSSKPSKVDVLPPWRVLLHNDEHNDMGFVVDTICMLTPLNQTFAIQTMLRAHTNGLALLVTTHKERAELYQDQFKSRGLVVTIEPAEK